MNPAYRHLVWKEYRAIRAFWLALVVLSLGLQWAAPQVVDDARLIVLNVALATPVFFAIGCIGTAFALEKEEGTYDWLRASPASDGLVFLAKISLCLIGTAAMYAVLWPVSQWITGGRMPEPGVWHGMLALWPLAALEAIAWGAFFSLRFERPLPAIMLALVVTSTIVHLAAMPYANVDFNFGRYLSAVPLRLVVIAPVLAYDIYLGLRWLQRENLRPTAGRAKVATAPRQVATPIAQKHAVTGYLRRSDRGMLLGHLLWQNLRQSWRLMLLMVALQFATMTLIGYSMIGSDIDKLLPLLPLIGFAALMGSSVFRPDQDGRSYRFFVEHNVPPRYVWLTRLLPWLVVAVLSGLLVAIYWLGSHNLLLLLTGSIDRGQQTWRQRGIEHAVIVFFGLGPATLAFAGGQWISMMVRSSLLASFFTLLLAAALTLWMYGCFVMRLSWLYFLVPIPLVFYFATWLRVPDWISENTTWRARTKAAAAVMVPALVLFTAAPIARVNQVPKLDPGFSVAAYLAEITPQALAAGELYKRANEALHDQDRRGQRALDLVLKASAAPDVVLADPATLVDWPIVRDDSLISLVNHSADRLVTAGRLEQARDRYLLAFKVVSDLTNHAPRLRDWYLNSQSSMTETFASLNVWGAHTMQSEVSLREAISRLQAISVDVLHPEDAIKSNYILCQRYIEGDERLATTLLGANNPLIFQRALVARLMPWEAFRELRALNLNSGLALAMTQSLRASLLADRGRDEAEPFSNLQENSPLYFSYYQASPLELSPLLSRWNGTSRQQMINFETCRRSTLIILASQAYQLKHGSLPNSLEDLISKPEKPGDGYFAALPTDPYTGRNYIYFRD
jgi:hypothetical protein